MKHQEYVLTKGRALLEIAISRHQERDDAAV
jgi:hypothetical protein